MERPAVWIASRIASWDLSFPRVWGFRMAHDRIMEALADAAAWKIANMGCETDGNLRGVHGSITSALLKSQHCFYLVYHHFQSLS